MYVWDWNGIPEHTGELTDSHLRTRKTNKSAPGRKNEMAKDQK